MGTKAEKVVKLHGIAVVMGPWLGRESSVEHWLVCREGLLTPGQAELLGRPAVVIRYGIGKGQEVMRFSYSMTAEDASAPISLLVTTPAHTVRIDIGIVTPGGETWAAPLLGLVESPVAMGRRLHKDLGRKVPMHMWDHSITPGRTMERYVWPSGETSRIPVGVDPAAYPTLGAVLGEDALNECEATACDVTTDDM